MVFDKLTSLELYLDFPAKQIIKTRSIEDVACGMYPCYYMECDDHLKASTSVISLIKGSGKFFLNTDFCPDYSNSDFVEHINCRWYKERLTVDKRIRRLKPFEIRTIINSSISFNPDMTIKDKEEFVSKSIECFRNFINDIEMKYPNHEHIVFTAGKDSQLIHLVPKIHKDKWHVFSSEPNTSLVRKWLKDNNIYVGEFFIHDNNDDDGEFLLKKVINSDFLSNPEHLRYSRVVEEIAKKFDKCFFWLGSMPSDSHFYCRHKRKRSHKNWIDDHFNRGALIAIDHQLKFNLTNCSVLSMYHSPLIWRRVYEHFNPELYLDKIDIREKMGERLAERKIRWLTENPEPAKWPLSNSIKRNLLQEYIKCAASSVL